MGETERLTAKVITEFQDKIAKQEQVNQELWAENEDLERKLKKIKQIINETNRKESVLVNPGPKIIVRSKGFDKIREVLNG